MDRVLYLWLGKFSPLDRLAKRIVWARLGTGRRVSWRKVSKRTGFSHEWCRLKYEASLMVLHKWLASLGYFGPEKNRLTKTRPKC